MQHGRDQVHREGLVCRGQINNHRFIRGLCFQSAAAENTGSAVDDSNLNSIQRGTVANQQMAKGYNEVPSFEILYMSFSPTVLQLVLGIEELRSSGAEVSTLVRK